MVYIPLLNRGIGARYDKIDITVTKYIIGFKAAFRQKYGLKKYILFYVNEENYLCFKLFDEKQVGSYCVTVNKGKAYFLRKPKMLEVLNVEQGQYHVTEKDGYFVTDIKLGRKISQE